MARVERDEAFQLILAGLIRRRRNQLGMRQEDVWRLLNVSRKTYAELETGRIRLNLQHIVALCPILKMKIGELFTEAEKYWVSGEPLPTQPKGFRSRAPIPQAKKTEIPGLPSWLGGVVPTHLEREHDAAADQLRRRNLQRDLEDSPELCEAHEA